MKGSETLAIKDINRIQNTNWVNVATADFNGDGKSDIIWNDISTGKIAVFIMNSSAIMNDFRFNDMYNINWEIIGAGDFDGSARNDILLKNKSTGKLKALTRNLSFREYHSFSKIIDQGVDFIGLHAPSPPINNNDSTLVQLGLIT